jgi:hypothetical protein
MANTEDAMIGLEELLLEEYPTFLRAIELEFKDGVVLENLREVSWEEYDDSLGIAMPGVMLLPETETDPALRDLLYDCRITAIFMMTDSDKRNVTKKMFRYGRALRRMLRPNTNRGLRGRVISAKVGAIRWLATGRGTMGRSAGLFARGFEADLVIRLPKESD